MLTRTAPSTSNYARDTISLLFGDWQATTTGDNSRFHSLTPATGGFECNGLP